jgi:hypothetical protein
MLADGICAAIQNRDFGTSLEQLKIGYSAFCCAERGAMSHVGPIAATAADGLMSYGGSIAEELLPALGGRAAR